jgi:diguanylate cyclase (GGDEF)-like protein
VIGSSGWATQHIAEFLAVITAVADDHAAVDAGLECLASSFRADACVFIRKGRVVSSRGWSGLEPGQETLGAATNELTGIQVPGVGWCETVAMGVDRDARTTILVARSGDRFSAEEIGLLRGMARVLGLGLRLLDAVAAEHELVASLRERQILLERLAQIQRRITSRESLQQILDAITSGAAELLGDERVGLRLVDESDPDFTVMASSVDVAKEHDGQLSRAPVRTGVGGRAIVEDRLCVAANYREADDAFTDGDVWAAMAAPVHLEGRAAGSLAVGSRHPGRTYSQAERDILVGFAEHASLALNGARAVEAMNTALNGAVHQAMHDALTGLPNRACFYDRTDQALRQAARGATCTAVLLFDLDHFKEINDTLGHQYGDRVLCAIGPRIRRVLRDADTLARLGGDEFCVLLPQVNGLGGALDVAERVMTAIEEPFDIDGITLTVGASCGVAIAPADGDSGDLLLQQADVAMYVAKGSAAHVVAYNDDLNVNTPARLSLLGEFRTAIGDDQLVLFYQPKADLGSGLIQGVEALIRWRHPTLGLVPPDRLIPLAEHTGLIKPLTSWVLNTSLCQLRHWRAQTDQSFPATLSMAINISTRSLLDNNFPAEVAAALDRWQIPAGLLDLEVTESGIMADPVRAHRLLTELAASGVKLSIDNFGTGYSSLAHLKNLPVDELKIDKSFVLHMHDDADDAVIVRSVIDLGHNLGLQTVAEGIEDLATWDQLTELGCDSAQGYFLARPMPAEDLADWLREGGAPPLRSIV